MLEDFGDKCVTLHPQGSTEARSYPYKTDMAVGLPVFSKLDKIFILYTKNIINILISKNCFSMIQLYGC